jgi:hypothetical protein
MLLPATCTAVCSIASWRATLRDLALAVAGRRGLDVSSTVYRSIDAYLRGAGIDGVKRREVKLPVGEWGGRVGSLIATDFRVAFTSIGQVLREYDELRTSTSLAIAYGRRPG